MLSRFAPRQAGEARQFGKRDIHPEDARAAAPGGDAGTKIGRQRRGVEELFKAQFRMEVRDDRVGLDPLARPGDDATGLALFHQNLGDRAAGSNLDPARRA